MEVSQHGPVVTSIEGMLKSLSPLSSECCIYKVPERLRKVNVEAYTPLVVSIGPFHHGEKRLQAMEEHKLRYLKTFLNRTGQRLKDCVEVVRTWEGGARACYAETIELSSDDFVKMILVDGCFIVELLLRSNCYRVIDNNDHIFHKPRMIDDVCHDMMLLENQLPLFVLEGFFDWVSASNQEGIPSFLKLFHNHINHLLQIKSFPDTSSYPGRKPSHFVDFIRCCHFSPFPGLWSQHKETYEFPPSVINLHEAGIKFKVVETNSSLLGIQFTNGILKIPHLVIEDTTETLFRNLIAFEQCHCKEKCFIHYIALLDGMINTSKDVDLLIQHRIIKSMLGSSEDISTLFNNVGKGVNLGPNFYFSSLCKDLNTHCKTSRHKWTASLKHEYLRNPWKVISIIAAFVLLLLTFIQTVCSVIALKAMDSD